nr:hypothetical protein [Candidatus Dependentiae bacterium]
MKKKIFCLLILFYSINSLMALNPVIIFQGKLTDNIGVRVNGTLPVIFSIYTEESGGAALWTETQNSVQFENGIFTTELGNQNPLTSLQLDKTYYLGINLNNTGELSPRRKINYNLYSIKSIYSDTASTTNYLNTNAVGLGSLIITDTLTVNGSFIVKKDGKVGINTSNPEEQLEISGKVKATHFIGDGSQLTGVQYTALTGDIISKTEVNSLLSKVGTDTYGLNIRINNLESDSVNTENRITSNENFINSITDTFYTESEINSKLNTLGVDTNALLNRVLSLESDSQNTDIRLMSLESDSQNTESRITLNENFINSITDTFYTESEINSKLNTLGVDTNALLHRVLS